QNPHGLSVETDVSGGHVLFQVLEARGAGDEQDVWIVGQEPGQSDLGRCGSVRGGGSQHRTVLGQFRPPREGRAEREVRHPGNVVLAAQVQERFAGPVGEGVGVLYARDAGRERLKELVDVDTAYTDAPDLALGAKRDHLGQLAVEVDTTTMLGFGKSQVD